MPFPLPASPAARPAWKRPDLYWLGACLVGIALIYGQVVRFDFLIWDDPGYVSANPVVRGGLSWAGTVWAFSGVHLSNWHPLTLLSHMLDAQLFGDWAGGHHLGNVLLHSLATVLLYAFLRHTGGDRWRAGGVALLFAIHPLHVESVAWVAERKDVLSGACWMATLLAYVHYCRRPALARYALMATCFGLGLLAKPSVVTLPLLLLLLDLWPLRRWCPGQRGGPGVLAALLVEKLPLVVPAIAVAWVTYGAQRASGAMADMAVVPFSDRLLNAVQSYGTYAFQTVLPLNLSFFYPLAATTVWWQVVLSGLALAVIGIVAMRRLAVAPHLAVGALWFVGTLVPMIGLVQVGGQAHADRYMYLPIVGLLLLAVWSVPDITRPVVRRAAIVAVALWGAWLAWTALDYTRSWRNSEALYARAIATHPDNCRARANYAALLIEGNRFDAARTQLAWVESSCADSISLELAGLAAGDLAHRQGAPGRAEAIYREIARRWPGSGMAQARLGRLLAEQERFAEAADALLVALPAFATDDLVRRPLGAALLMSPRHRAEAVYYHRLWADEAPGNAAGWHYLGIAQDNAGDAGAALEAYRRSLSINPQSIGTRLRLARLLAATGQLASAAAEAESILQQAPGEPNATRLLSEVRAR